MTDKVKTAAILTLGCRVNQYESDVISESLMSRGFTMVPFGTSADITVINTCTVTGESDRKSRQMIRRAAAASVGSPVIVTGCFAETGREVVPSLGDNIYIVGNAAKSHVADIAERLILGETVHSLMPDISSAPFDRMILNVPQRTRSYIKIEDGCNNHCSYCIIPSARGRVRSKAADEVTAEAEALLENGCREIILTGIETASYGLDFGERDSYFGESLATLIRRLDALGVPRIGLASLEPTVMNESFVHSISEIPSLLPHFHLSVQSASSSVLKRMRRRYNAEMLDDAMARVRAAIPDVTFSADVITGFPGESDEEFSKSAERLMKNRFLHLHIFPYSEREGTEAAGMTDVILQSVRRERLHRLSDMQKEVKLEMLSEYVSNHALIPVNVLVESVTDGIASGHTEHCVEIKFECTCADVGEIVQVLATGHDGEVCFGRKLH